MKWKCKICGEIVKKYRAEHLWTKHADKYPCPMYDDVKENFEEIK